MIVRVADHKAKHTDSYHTRLDVRSTLLICYHGIIYSHRE